MDIIHNFLTGFMHEYELFVRLLFACVCATAIGLERRRRGKDAGIKTHVILAMGACLIMIISQYGFETFSFSENYKVDISRIASAITTGVSFLCAGVIFVRGGSVKGLTTATGIWATAGIGMAAGAGLYMLTLFSTFLVLAIQFLFTAINRHLPIHSTMYVTLSIDSNENIEDKIEALSKRLGGNPSDSEIDTTEEGVTVIKLIYYINKSFDFKKILEISKSDSNIKSIHFE